MVQRVPNVRALTAAAAPLERIAGDAEPPHLIDAKVVEDPTLRARPVPGAPVPGFGAFLDGVQQSHVLAWVGAAPIVYGVTAAVIRVRTARRLLTWDAPLVNRRIYAPLPYAPAEALAEAFSPDVVVDTAHPAADGTLPPRHPTLLLERARLAVSRDRELLEQQLAERWCRTRSEPLMIDGGIGGNDVVAHAPVAVGVVKSHRTLYVSDAALETVLALRRGERSSVIRITPHGRNAVHSWYLRLRDPTGHDALWGLVRLEVAASAAMNPGARADEVSRWMLAEMAPLASPDPRWDKMAYGIKSCETFLGAVS